MATGLEQAQCQQHDLGLVGQMKEEEKENWRREGRKEQSEEDDGDRVLDLEGLTIVGGGFAAPERRGGRRVEEEKRIRIDRGFLPLTFEAQEGVSSPLLLRFPHVLLLLPLSSSCASPSPSHIPS